MILHHHPLFIFLTVILKVADKTEISASAESPQLLVFVITECETWSQHGIKQDIKKLLKNKAQKVFTFSKAWKSAELGLARYKCVHVCECV